MTATAVADGLAHDQVIRKPNWSAAATAVGEERSFTVPVGFEPSNFTWSRRTPRAPAEGRAVEQRALHPRRA